MPEPTSRPEYTVGDINSTERGTGARANGGKPAMELLPLDQLHKTMPQVRAAGYLGLIASKTVAALWENLSAVQREHRERYGHWAIGYAMARMNADLDRPAVDWAEVCDVWKYGLKTYRPWNWAKGMPWSVPLACAARHLLAYDDGVVTDEESRCHHLAHFICNMQMLIHFMRYYPELNDLPNPKYFMRAEGGDD